jgi:hypothetical protein
MDHHNASSNVVILVPSIDDSTSYSPNAPSRIDVKANTRIYINLLPSKMVRVLKNM